MGSIIVIVGMLLMIVIHEAGHFVAAKFFDMKATEAFFGFGPRLWSTQRGETEYGIKAIPLGGYVRIIGMNPFEEIPAEEEHRTYRGKPFWQKTVVVLAGIATHFVIGFFLFYIVLVNWDVREITTEVDNVSEVLVTSSGAAEELPLELLDGDSVLSVDGIPLSDLSTTTTKAADDVVTVVIEREGAELSFETSDNVVAAPSYVIGILPGDRLVAIDGIEIESWVHFVELAHDRPGVTANVEIERAGEIIASDVVLSRRSLDGEIVGFLGVGPAVKDIDYGLIDGFGLAASEVRSTTWLSLEGLWTMVRRAPELVGAAVGQDASVLEEARPVSVIGIARVASGPQSALAILAYVNIFVGTLNFIPLYPLDGGHFSVALYEKIRGKEADVRPLIPVAAAVFIFIMLLGVLGIYFDIVDPINLNR